MSENPNFLNELISPIGLTALVSAGIGAAIYIQANQVKVEQLTKLPDNTVVNQPTIFGDRKVKIGDILTTSNYNNLTKIHQTHYWKINGFGEKDSKVFGIVESQPFGGKPITFYLNTVEKGLGSAVNIPQSSTLIDKKQIVNDGKNKNPDLQTPKTDNLGDKEEKLGQGKPNTIP